MYRPSNVDNLYHLQPGKHLYQFYKNTDDFVRVITSFFQAGLEKGNACLWLVSEKIGVEKAKTFLEIMIPKCAGYLASGQLQILSGEAWYLDGGRFSENRIVRNLEQFLEFVKKGNFSGIRICGDGASIPRNQWEFLFRYEKKIDPVLREKRVICVCAYPILGCSVTDTKTILDLHKDGVFIGHIT